MISLASHTTRMVIALWLALASPVGANQALPIDESAFAEFEALGLELPAVDVRHHDPEDCPHEFFGTFREGIIELCTDHFDTMLHELAHAYLSRAAERDMRAEFVAAFDWLDCWACDDAPWMNRGTEFAAEAVVWWIHNHDRPRFHRGHWFEAVEVLELNA